VVSLGLRKDFPASGVRAFYDGLEAWGGSFGVDIVGGDTVGARDFTVNVALLGEVEKGKALKRSSAKVGDVLMVTGSLGDSAVGLHSLQHPGRKGQEVRALLERRHRTPVPRCVVGRFLVETGWASSCIDISDGLSSEVHHLADESDLGAEIYAEDLPVSPAVDFYCGEWGLDPGVFALHGGEDYELLFTVPAKKVGALLGRLNAETGAAVRPIGLMTPRAKGVRLVTAGGKAKALTPRGYDHFKGL
jgi:thiamine-monophosphate kinase